MTNRIIFYSSIISNRLQYITHLVFNELLGIDIIFTQNNDLFIEIGLPKINFSDSPLFNNEIHIKPHILIFENSIRKYEFTEASFYDLDIFSRIFYLVSRYEEYTAPPSVLDAHQRFPASASMAKKLDFLHKPIVNEWVMDLKNGLTEKFPSLIFDKKPIFSFQATYDIDQAWAYKNKGFWRNMGGLGRDILRGSFKMALWRMGVSVGVSNDPEYTFGYMESLHKKYNLEPIFFWLLGDYGENDKNIHWQNRALQHLIRHIAKRYKVGIHPSYQSNTDINILKTEVSRLDTIINRTDEDFESRLSRQHYLKLRFPDTYRHLISVGITDDYSLGYADDIGFRASIASPFYWYDLENEQVTHLKIHPFQVMEVTLQQYLALSPEKAVEYVLPLIESTKKVGGTFTTLWHNSSFSNTEGWKGWRIVYEKIIETSVK